MAKSLQFRSNRGHAMRKPSSVATLSTYYRGMRALLSGCAVFVFFAGPAAAVPVPFDFGNWTYDAPAGTTITETPGRVAKTFGLTLTTSFADANEKVITFKTSGMHLEDERFFMFNMNIKNADSLNRDWVGFIIKTLDQIEVGPNTQDPNNIRDHPKWAHIHPLHSAPYPSAVPVMGAPTGANYTNFTTLDPDVGYGVEALTLTGGTVFDGDTWSPDRIRLHDKNALGDMFVSADTGSSNLIGSMEFRLVLQPMVVPEPGTLALVGVGVAALCIRNRRRKDSCQQQ